MQEIANALTRIFERHRIVFWYDAKRELHAEFNELTLPQVEKITLNNNQFGVKHRILREEPKQKFLLYQEGPPPADLDNWLLDVELAHSTFRADQTALWLTELGLGMEFGEVLAPHTDFFQAAKRREALKRLLRPDDTPRTVRLKLLAVCVGGEPRLDDILETLLAELASERDERIRLVERCGLADFLWEQVGRIYGYTSATPGLRDFVIELFKSCYALEVGETAHLGNDALVFLKRWKDSVRHHAAFETLSAQCAEILNIELDLQAREYTALVDADLFELIDRRILSDLAREVANRTIAAGACEQVVRRRRQSHWYDRYCDLYEAIDTAAQFLHKLDTVDLQMSSLAAGIQQYGRVWFRLDQLYRHFIFHARRSGQPTLLAELQEKVESLYTNRYLLPLNDNWQQIVDATDEWQAPPVLYQRDFYRERVRPIVNRGNKIFVVISDALRYEAGEELLRRIRQEDRYEATLEAALSVLPSYTQLGMAALLPHTALAFALDGAPDILVDAASPQGLENRKKILDRAMPGHATAIRAEELLGMGRDESRTLIRDHEVVYVYHNRIDATGDKRDTETRVFEAVEQALDELIRIIKKLTNANANNLLVTSDHGFLYQDRALDESDFAGEVPAGDELLTHNRRFVLGRGLVAGSSFKKFNPGQVGIHGNIDILLPKSINRLRLQGAGSRYVHGGASLQEVTIPIVQINKKRQSDVSMVGADIIRSTNSTISTGQLSVAFYQTEPVTEKVQPRVLRAGIYSQTGGLISDVHELTFDLTSTNPREREMVVQFVLTREAEAANNQEVILRLDERVADTSHYREYKSARYMLRRSFTSDFDL